MTPQEEQATKPPYKSITKFDLKDTPQHATGIEGASQGGRRYSHLAELDPAFAAVKPRLDASAKALWDVPGRNWNTLRETVRRRSHEQQVERSSVNVDISHGTVGVRDGAEINIKIMRRASTAPAKEQTTDQGASLLVLRIHGGGWCLDPESAGEEAEDGRIAGMQNVVLVRVSYRLAPEYPYPYALNDCYDVLLWCKINADDLGVDPERMLLIGSGAGASLAASVAVKARDKGVTGIVGQVLDFPMTCHPKFYPQGPLELKSYEQNSEATTISSPLVDLFYDAYVPDSAEEVSYHSPLLAPSLAHMPPALVQVAGFDPLRDEGIAFSERLKGQGVASELHVYKGLPHGFPDVLPDLPQTCEFYNRQQEFIRVCVDREGIFS
ncbi:hypothetical protein RB595_002950 [Gaeumannomyces hyphopodioides]